MTVILVTFGISVLVMSITLVLSGKLTGVRLSLVDTLIAATVASFFALVTALGWLVSAIVLVFLLKKMTGAPIFPNLILMIVISELLIALAAMALTSYIHSVA